MRRIGVAKIQKNQTAHLNPYMPPRKTNENMAQIEELRLLIFYVHVGESLSSGSFTIYDIEDFPCKSDSCRVDSP